jgi:HSP20 family molecular chaperone IbpA
MQVSDLSVAKPRFDNGLLKVTLPKRPELVGEQRKIEIKKN